MHVGLPGRRQAVITKNKEGRYAITIQVWRDGGWRAATGGVLAPQDDQLAALDHAIEWNRRNP